MTAAEANALSELYAAFGYFARELERLYDTNAAIISGLGIEEIAGAVLENQTRLERMLRTVGAVREQHYGL